MSIHPPDEHIDTESPQVVSTSRSGRKTSTKIANYLANNLANHVVAAIDGDTTALNLDEGGGFLTYKNAMRGPDKANWVIAAGEEFIRLKDSGTIEFIREDQMPKDRRASYYNPQVKKKFTEGGVKYRGTRNIRRGPRRL